MQSEEVRRGYSARGFCFMSPWNITGYMYSVLQLYLGYNPMSKLEVVSALNSFNTSILMYEYSQGNRTLKYNPKVYLSAVQTVSYHWNEDRQTGQNNGLENQDGSPQKSGSWPENGI